MNRTLAKVALGSLIAAALLGTGVHRAAAADPVADPTYCPYGSVAGTGSWFPAVTQALAPHTMSVTLAAQCPGAGDEAGSYSITLSGNSNENCGAGTGSGTVSGTAPEGSMSGSFTFYKGGIHYYISGTFTADGEDHNLQLWLDVLPDVNGVCAYSSSPIIGHGAFVDQIPLPVPGAQVVDFEGVTTMVPPVQVFGGAGAYELRTDATSVQGVPGACLTAYTINQGTCSLDAKGTYVNTVCGTGMTGGGPLAQTDTAQVVTAGRTTTVNYGTVFVAGHGTIIGTWSASDGTSGTAGGYVDLVPTSGNCATQVEQFLGIGQLVLLP